MFPHGQPSPKHCLDFMDSLLTQTCCGPNHCVEARSDAVSSLAAPATEDGPVMVVVGQLLHGHAKQPACDGAHCHAGDEETRGHLQKHHQSRPCSPHIAKECSKPVVPVTEVQNRARLEVTLKLLHLLNPTAGKLRPWPYTHSSGGCHQARSKLSEQGTAISKPLQIKTSIALPSAIAYILERLKVGQFSSILHLEKGT